MTPHGRRTMRIMWAREIGVIWLDLLHLPRSSLVRFPEKLNLGSQRYCLRKNVRWLAVPTSVMLHETKSFPDGTKIRFLMEVPRTIGVRIWLRIFQVSPFHHNYEEIRRHFSMEQVGWETCLSDRHLTRHRSTRQ